MSAPTAPAAEAEKSTLPAGVSGRSDLVRLGVRIAVLLAAVFATVAAIAFLVPEQNDYSLGIELKHRRLAEINTRKIVLVGGSNLAYGVDSKMLQKATGCPVVNMGMNGYFGVRYMLEEVKDQIRPSDIIVLSFEYDNLFKSVDGSPGSHLAIIKAYPTVFGFLSAEQKLQVIAAIPTVAQAKIIRLMTDAITTLKEPFTGRNYGVEGPADLNEIESLKGFSPEGDITAHLGIKWPFVLENAVVPQGAKIDMQMIALMRGFGEEMQRRGVPVMVSYTPVIRETYDKLQGDLTEFDRMIKSSPPLIAPSPPSAFAYDKSMFFDTVYHLNERGRPVRTQRLIDDLATTLGARARCP